MESKMYDVMILGGGPGGLAAGLYAGRSKLSTVIIEKGIDGGQIAITHDIENYPGQAKVDGLGLIGTVEGHAGIYILLAAEYASLDGDVRRIICAPPCLILIEDHPESVWELGGKGHYVVPRAGLERLSYRWIKIDAILASVYFQHFRQFI